MDASEIYSKRLNAKEVLFPKENGKFIFPAADGRIKTLGGDQDLRTSTSIRDHPIRGEGRRDFLGESEGSLHHLKGEWDRVAEKICKNLAKADIQSPVPRVRCPEVSSKAKAVENYQYTIVPIWKRLKRFFAQLFL